MQFADLLVCAAQEKVQQYQLPLCRHQTLQGFVKAEQSAVDSYEQDRTDFDSFAAVIRKYVGIRELAPTIANEFVKKIIVHAPDKSSGHRRQKVEIVWNFIGKLEQDDDTQTAQRQRKSRTA